MEPVYMALGQAAGATAAFALRAGTAVQDVPYATLREQLLADGAKLSGDPAPKTGATGTPTARDASRHRRQAL
jgi:hypothetical protein